MPPLLNKGVLQIYLRIFAADQEKHCRCCISTFGIVFLSAYRAPSVEFTSHSHLGFQQRA
jgi:hypothetical protein